MTHPKHLLLATVLAAASTLALAQTPPAPPAAAAPGATQAAQADSGARQQRWAEAQQAYFDAHRLAERFGIFLANTIIHDDDSHDLALQ